MGHFVPQQVQDLFPNHLCRQHPFRLVGEFFVGEVVGSRLCQCHDFLFHKVDAVGFCDADRNSRRKRVCRIQSGNGGHQLGLVAAKVDLVQHQNGGRFCLFQRTEQFLLLLGEGLGAVLYKQYRVNVCHRIFHRFQHVPAELGRGLVQTRGVHENHLRFPDCFDAGDAGACRLGLRAD